MGGVLSQLIKHSIFNIVHRVLKLARIVDSPYKVRTLIDENDAETHLVDDSATIYRIVARSQMSPMESPFLSNFMLIREKKVNLIQAILNSPEVSLMNLDNSYAIFAVVPNSFNVNEEKHGPFFYHVQYANAVSIITVPIQSFLKLPSATPNYKIKKAMVWSTGRCGSTLLTKMLSSISHTVKSISEPDAFKNVKSESFEECTAIVSSIIELQCKDFEEDSLVFMKPRSAAVSIMNAVHQGSPDVAHIFMYRNPIKTIGSFCGLVNSVPRFFRKMAMNIMKNEILRSMKFPNLDINLMDSEMSKAIQDYDFVAFFACFYIANIKGYLHAKQSGVNVHIIKYENLLYNPVKEVKLIVEHCGRRLAGKDLEKCKGVMERDSQEGSKMSRNTKEGKGAYDQKFYAENEAKINLYFGLFGLPPTKDFDKIFI